MRLKSPKMILKVTSLREVTGARICYFYLCISFYPIKLKPRSLSCSGVNIRAPLYHSKQPVDNISTMTDAV